jgi:type I restriction enzyme S subunit
VPFSEIMKENKNTIIIDDKQEYQRITVKLHGYGVVPRDLVIGKKIKTKEQKVTRENQFIVAEIDAKLGAFGIISKQWTNSIVSSHYFLFDLDDTKILPEYFDYVIRQGPYTEMIQPFVKGTTNYASIRPKHILKLKMPLPKIPEQQKILDIISKKKQHLVELEKAKEKAVKDIQIIVDELFQKK